MNDSRHHHTPQALEAIDEAGRLMRAVVAANDATKAIGYAFIEPMTWDHVLEHPVWAHLLAHDLPAMEHPDVVRQALCDGQDQLDTYVAHLSPSLDFDADEQPTPRGTAPLR